MTDPKHLSNKELVKEARFITIIFTDEIRKRRKELFEEILRRLNEPWRNPKVSQEMWSAYNKGKEAKK